LEFVEEYSSFASVDEVLKASQTELDLDDTVSVDQSSAPSPREIPANEVEHPQAVILSSKQRGKRPMKTFTQSTFAQPSVRSEGSDEANPRTKRALQGSLEGVQVPSKKLKTQPPSTPAKADKDIDLGGMQFVEGDMLSTRLVPRSYRTVRINKVHDDPS
jgi:hypothetical protein